MTGRSHRSIHRLLAHALEDVGETPADMKTPWTKPEDKSAVTLCEWMWRETSQSRDKVLSTTFIQDMKLGKLDPVSFGGYMVQDAVFCLKARSDLALAAKKATEPDLKKFLEEKSKEYKSYYEDMFKEWHISDPNGIGLGQACQAYVDVLNDTARTRDPIYLVVASIPCIRLWPWIGQKMDEGKHDFGCYTEWKDDNFVSGDDGYKKYENRVNYAFRHGKLDWKVALEIYKKCMHGEANFFDSAE